MKLHTSNEAHFVLADVGGERSTLYCLSKGGTLAAHELPEKVTGLLLRGEELLCLAESRSERHTTAIVLHGFDLDLRELSRRMLADAHGLLSAMDGEHIYILGTDTAGVDFGDSRRTCSRVCTLAFTRISIETGERTAWTLDDSENDDACSKALEELTDGYVTAVDALRVFDGKPMLLCSVYDPDSVAESDDPNFDENELSDSDYVELHSFAETICADVEQRALTFVHRFYSEFPAFQCAFPAWAREETVLNALSMGSKTYVATARWFYCIDSRQGQYLVNAWGRVGLVGDDEDAPDDVSEQYRDFYAWGNELIFESRNGEKLTGFRVCPAQSEEPGAAAWRTVAVK